MLGPAGDFPLLKKKESVALEHKVKKSEGSCRLDAWKTGNMDHGERILSHGTTTRSQECF